MVLGWCHRLSACKDERMRAPIVLLSYVCLLSEREEGQRIVAKAIQLLWCGCRLMLKRSERAVICSDIEYAMQQE